MKVRKIYYDRDFKKKLKRFSTKDQQKILKKVRVFMANPFSPSLKTHKLTGKLSGYWSFSINPNLRIMFQFQTKSSVNFIDIGTHEIYK